MVVDRKDCGINNLMISDLRRCMKPDSILVLNDTRVRKARLFGSSQKSGKTIEFLLLRELKAGVWEVMVRRLKRLKEGDRFVFPNGLTGKIVGKNDRFIQLEFSCRLGESYFDKFGHIPLPPYIKRRDDFSDEKRYQTIFSSAIGSAAAPTAGLHFTDGILRSLSEAGVRMVNITLHIGAGTFIPISTENIEDHAMHEEEYSIPEESAAIINNAVHAGKEIIAVGTTVVRALESSWVGNSLKPGKRRTDLYIYPGYQFNVVTKLLTNFHTPGSTLFLLVSAFAGRECILKSYGKAVELRYRFFSYGDVMLIL